MRAGAPRHEGNAVKDSSFRWMNDSEMSVSLSRRCKRGLPLGFDISECAGRVEALFNIEVATESMDEHHSARSTWELYSQSSTGH
jgi:hypothetical protein